GTDSTAFLRLRQMVWESRTSMAPGMIFLIILGLPLSSFSPESCSSTIDEKVERPTFEDASAGSTQRSKFHLMCSAVSSSPLCHNTPLRMLKVQVFRSSEASQLSASMGRVMLSGPVIARYSTMWRVWFDISVHE